MTGGLVGALRDLVARREECQGVVAVLDQHRRASALGGSATASGVADLADGGGLLSIWGVAAGDLGGSSSGGDGGVGAVRGGVGGGGRSVVVVAGGWRELLLQQMDDDRRAHDLETQRRGHRLNELVCVVAF